MLNRSIQRCVIFLVFIFMIVTGLIVHFKSFGKAFSSKKQLSSTWTCSEDKKKCSPVDSCSSYEQEDLGSWEEIATAKTAFDFAQLKFHPQFRNPCFCQKNQNGNLQLFCLPAFFLAGIEKCGTTDLYTTLALHPRIARPAGKEPQFWGKLQHADRDFGAYLRWFLLATEKITTNFEVQSDGHIRYPYITFDGSPSVLSLQYIWRKYVDVLNVTDTQAQHVNHIWTPSQLQRVLPDAKYVVILRDPVDRLYSSYLFYPLLGTSERRDRRKRLAVFSQKSAADFHEKVLHAIAAFNKCRQRHPENNECFFFNSNEDGNAVFLSKLQMGIYWAMLSAWFKTMSRSQFYLVSFSDYRANKTTAVNGIFRFLGLPALSDSLMHSGRTGIARYNHRKERIGHMMPETRKILSEFYRPHNKLLQELLQPI